MTTPWTRPQKIAVWGVVVGAASAIAGFGLIFFETRKLNFEISKFNVAETQRVEEERRRLEEELSTNPDFAGPGIPENPRERWDC